MDVDSEMSRMRYFIIGASLLALFLGALDALVMTAAMPTIIADLGGLKLYAWAYSTYFLARAVSLPVFGKLSDLFAVKKLFLVSIALFVASSAAAGAAPTMIFLVIMRLFQGIGSGGIFALVYVVLTDVSLPGQRPKVLSFASSVWGIASLIGPTFGGVLITWYSWRWIFFINLPLGLISLGGVALFFREFREKPGRAQIDWKGVLLLSGTILGLLILAMAGGRNLPWDSAAAIFLVFCTVLAGTLLYGVEKKAEDPILNFAFFKFPGYALGNIIVFFASFSVFALFAYAPLFLQGGLSLSPLHVGYAMLSLSLGWSIGSFIVGRIIQRLGQKKATVAGALLLVGGSALTMKFSGSTTIAQCFLVFQITGIGMGFISLSTLLIVQDSIEVKNLGIATSFHQFSRTLGGAFGVGICGGFVTARLIGKLAQTGNLIPSQILVRLHDSLENLLQPEFQALIPQGIRTVLQSVVLESVFYVFFVVFIVSLICLVLSLSIPVSCLKKQR